jgi:phospholipase C
VYDPGYDDHLGGVAATPIFEALDKANVSWKVYYTYTNGECTDADDCGAGAASYPALDVDYIYYDTRYLYPRPGGATCNPPTVESITVGDASNYYCVDPNHIAPLATYFSDVANGTLASVSFIEPGYGHNDEHPGSYQPILLGQTEVAKVVNAFMANPSWSDSVFFFSYDEGGGPYDHVPPIPGHSNDFTDVTYQGQPFKANYPDIGPITVNPDEYPPCLPADGIVTAHCDLHPSDPGAHAGDAAKVDGFAAQIGFRLPNFVVSPFTRRHYVSHIPMDHTAVIKFIENRFIGPTAHLTARDAAQPDLLDFFDFNGVPWATPPTPPAPFQQPAGVELCTPANLGP